MTNKTLAQALLVLLVVIKLCVAACPPGYLTCGTLCYTPASHSCHGGTLCPPGAELCGTNSCYFTTQYTCVNGQLIQQNTGAGNCPSPQQPCGTACYNNNTQVCINNTVCNSGQGVCGTQCYALSTHVCFNNQTICLSGQQLCGNNCYSPSSQQCFNNQTVCGSTQQLCGTNCYSPGTQQCFNDQLVCQAGSNIQACGNSCYNNNTQVCLTGNIVCIINQTLCNGFCCGGEVGEVLTFSDDFNSFNLKTWKHEVTASGGGNGEFQFFTNNRTISYTRNGTLFIRPERTDYVLGFAPDTPGASWDWGMYCTNPFNSGCLKVVQNGLIINPVASARVSTKFSFAFKYGRVEIRAKLPAGDWMWPALWLLPRDYSYGDWPSSGEIDIVESRGNRNYPNNRGVQTTSSTLHFGPTIYDNAYPFYQGFKTLSGQTFNDAFHVFGMYWDENQLYTYIDSPDNKVLQVAFNPDLWTQANARGLPWNARNYNNPWSQGTSSAPFDQEFYLILQVAVGATNGYFDEATNKPWDSTSALAPAQFWNNRDQWYPTWQGESAALQVDSVKVWTFPGKSTFSTGQNPPYA